MAKKNLDKSKTIDKRTSGIGGTRGLEKRGASSDEPTVLLEVQGEIATITLNRPAQRNAISPQMIEELDAALVAANDGPARVVILTGAGTAFCGGMDLKSLLDAAGQPHAGHLDDSRRLVALFQRLHGLPVPTIAAVNGPAIAGGCGVATLCDFTLAVPTAKFGYTEVRIGFIPAIVSCYLVRQLGDRKARDLLLTARIFGAPEALAMGLINEIVERERLMARALELAGSLAAHSPESLRKTKAMLQKLPGASLEAVLEQAAQASAAARQSVDYQEGLASFLEKRRPHWRSK